MRLIPGHAESVARIGGRLGVDRFSSSAGVPRSASPHLGSDRIGNLGGTVQHVRIGLQIRYSAGEKNDPHRLYLPDWSWIAAPAFVARFAT